MGKLIAPDRGRLVHLNAGLGQERVDETGPGPVQEQVFPPAAGGAGTGSGDGAKTLADDRPARAPEPKPWHGPQIRGH